MICRRREKNEIISLIHNIEPDAFFMIEQAGQASKSYISSARSTMVPVGGWRSILKKNRAIRSGLKYLCPVAERFKNIKISDRLSTILSAIVLAKAEASAKGEASYLAVAGPLLYNYDFLQPFRTASLTAGIARGTTLREVTPHSSSLDVVSGRPANSPQTERGMSGRSP